MWLNFDSLIKKERFASLPDEVVTTPVDDLGGKKREISEQNSLKIRPEIGKITRPT